MSNMEHHATHGDIHEMSGQYINGRLNGDEMLILILTQTSALVKIHTQTPYNSHKKSKLGYKSLIKAR